jgi:hypothetical protein
MRKYQGTADVLEAFQDQGSTVAPIVQKELQVRNL